MPNTSGKPLPRARSQDAPPLRRGREAQPPEDCVCPAARDAAPIAAWVCWVCRPHALRMVALVPRAGGPGLARLGFRAQGPSARWNPWSARPPGFGLQQSGSPPRVPGARRAALRVRPHVAQQVACCEYCGCPPRRAQFLHLSAGMWSRRCAIPGRAKASSARNCDRGLWSGAIAVVCQRGGGPCRAASVVGFRPGCRWGAGARRLYRKSVGWLSLGGRLARKKCDEKCRVLRPRFKNSSVKDCFFSARVFFAATPFF